MVTHTNRLGDFVTRSFAAAMGLPRLILASGSPRRRELLARLGLDFSVIVADVDETVAPEERPRDYVERLSLAKARAVARANPNLPVLGSDTSVIVDGHILGKPRDESEAKSMLQVLSGRNHTVLTAFSLVRESPHFSATECSATTVTFRTLESDEIDAYVATGAPMDKAGGYGIQDDIGSLFVERIEGDFFTVVGLPVARVYSLLRTVSHSDGDRKT